MLIDTDEVKVILLDHRAGSQLAGVVPKNFDTQKWAESRKEGFALLEIERVREVSLTMLYTPE